MKDHQSLLKQGRAALDATRPLASPLARRSFLSRALAYATVAAIARPVYAQADNARKAAEPVLDIRPGRVEILSAEASQSAGAMGGQAMRVHFGRAPTAINVHVREADDKSGDAIVTINGVESRIRKNEDFRSNLMPTDGNAKSSSSFWGCFIGTMIGYIGAGAWNNVKNNYQSMWNSTSGVWWKRIFQFLAKVFSLPYASFAIQAITHCK